MSQEKKERIIKLNISDKDFQSLMIKSAKGGISIEELLENFIADLIGSSQSNGSDERDKVNEWYNRCGFQNFAEDSLLKFLLDFSCDTIYQVENILNLLTNIQYGEEDLEKYQTEPQAFCKEEIDFLKEDLQSWNEEYNDIISKYKKSSPNVDIENELIKVREWYDKYESTF